jgi:hypothetical protein
MNEVTMRIEGDKIITKSPYNTKFSPDARMLGGTWNASAKTWTFDARDERRVRELLVHTYGTDGISAPDVVTVRCNLDALEIHNPQELVLFGRPVATRLGRDSAVRLGDGVILVAGGFSASGGSRANPRLCADPGTVLEVRDVPRARAEAKIAAHPTGFSLVPMPALPTTPQTGEGTQSAAQRLAEVHIDAVAYVPTPDDFALLASINSAPQARLQFLAASIASLAASTPSANPATTEHS